MAEREQRLASVAVEGAVADEQALGVAEYPVVWLRRRQAFLARGPGGRQPPARLRLAEQDVGQRVAELLPAEPGQQDRRHLTGPGQQDRGPGVDHDHGPRVGRGHLADQFVLASGQRERRAVEAFALHLGGGADHHHGHVAARRQGDGERLLRGRFGELAQGVRLVFRHHQFVRLSLCSRRACLQLRPLRDNGQAIAGL